MMAARANGQRVACITATKGEAGENDLADTAAGSLGYLRQKELEDALQILDIPEHYWLGYHDGGCKDVDTSQAVAQIAKIISEVQPDTILTFGPDGMTGHDDHKTVSEWAALALAATGHQARIMHFTTSLQWFERIGKLWGEKFNVYFNIEKPVLTPEKMIDLHFRPPADLLERKLAALKAQATQTKAMFEQLAPDQMSDVADCECFMLARPPMAAPLSRPRAIRSLSTRFRSAPR